MNLRSVLAGWPAGVAAGIVISVTPLPLNLGLAVGLGVAGWIRHRGSREGAGRRFLGSSMAAMGTVALAIALPVKQLDGAVPPFHYGPRTLDELCATLRSDHRVLVRAKAPLGTNDVSGFTSLRVMSRREVLQKLALETGTELRVGACGTGATFLFGAHPSFTRLQSRITNRAETLPPPSPAGSPQPHP